MCVREYDLKVPFGVVSIDKRRITSIDEKPTQRVFVNAGIYVLNPEMLDLIPSNQMHDMTTLFDQIIELGHEPAVFPIEEYWLDVGRVADFERANVEFGEVFSAVEAKPGRVGRARPRTGSRRVVVNTKRQQIADL
jgi:NDP-sugar pyrophosphorylase family protein